MASEAAPWGCAGRCDLLQNDTHRVSSHHAAWPLSVLHPGSCERQQLRCPGTSVMPLLTVSCVGFCCSEHSQLCA